MDEEQDMTQGEIPIHIENVKLEHAEKWQAWEQIKDSYMWWDDAMSEEQNGQLIEWITSFAAETHSLKLTLCRKEKKEFEANVAEIKAREALVEELEAKGSPMFAHAALADLEDHERKHETWLLDEIEARTGKRPEASEAAAPAEETVEAPEADGSSAQPAPERVSP